MSKSKREQLQEQEKLILQKRKEIENKKSQHELLEKLRAQTSTDQTTTQPFLPNDGSFLENFKKLTQGSSSSTNQSVSVPQMNAIPSPSPLEVDPTHPMRESVEPTSSEIQIIRTDDPSCVLPGSSIKVPSSREQLVELVAVNGDGYEENLRTQCKRIDLCQEIRFIFDKDCHEHKAYRREVTERRTVNKRYDEIEAYRNKPSRSGPIEPKIFGSTQESKTKPITIIRNDDSESTNSDTDTWKEAKERNLKNLKRKVQHVKRKKQFNCSTSDSSDDNQNEDGGDPTARQRFERKHKMSSASSSSSANSKKDQDPANPDKNDRSSEGCSRQPKRKKSRWGEAPPAEKQQPPTPTAIVVQSTMAPTSKPQPVMLSTVTRTDPALLQYARQNFGTTNLTEEDWKKAEEHYKINLLYQDMQRKRQEIDKLAKKGKFKYEYDSDEDVNGGTWEHKVRASEMEATIKWADALNKQCEGKHHIGDFLPPEELKKFMEKYNSEKIGKAPDVSDYKDFKLKEDNKGYQMLQKMGWQGEGTSLGSTGSGITEPINKAPQLAEHQGLGANAAEEPNENDDEYDAYRKRMMLAYRFRPNPLNNPRRAYY